MKSLAMVSLLIKKEQKKTRGLFLWLFCHTYTFGSALYDCQFFIIECVKDDINLSTERGFISLLIRKYVLVSRYTKHRDKLNKLLKAWMLPLVLNRLEMSWSNVKLFS